MIKKLRELVSTIPRDKLEHIFISVCFLWIMLPAWVIFGVTGGAISILLYIIAVFVWEWMGETPFSLEDISVSIIPILPAIILMLNT